MTTRNHFAKRVLDCAIAGTVLLITAPLLAVIALAIVLTSPGPVLYRGRRVGRNGRVFQMLKFRTMVADAESRGGSATANDDPRITRIGRFLRKCKLDEFPQFFNVLTGEMSLVGPRPEVEKYIAMLSGRERRILDVTPGITDWASIWNSDEGTVLEDAEDPEAAYERLIRPTKIALQLLYVDTHSVAADLRILGWTALRLAGSNRLPPEIQQYGNPRTLAHDRAQTACQSGGQS